MSDPSEPEQGAITRLHNILYPIEHHHTSRVPSPDARATAPDQVDNFIQTLQRYSISLGLYREPRPEEIYMDSSYDFQMYATRLNHPQDELWREILQKRRWDPSAKHIQDIGLASCSWCWSDKEQRITHLLLSTSTSDPSAPRGKELLLNREVDIAWAKKGITWIWEQAFGTLAVPPIVIMTYRAPGNIWRYGDWCLAQADGPLGRLITLVQTGTWQQRTKAARELGSINNPRAIAILIKLVEFDTASSVHKAAAEGLRAYKHEAAQAIFDRILNHYCESDYVDMDRKEYERCERLFDVLRSFGTSLLNMYIDKLVLPDIDNRHRVYLVDILASLDQEEVARVFAARLPDFDSTTQQRLQRILTIVQDNAHQGRLSVSKFFFPIARAWDNR